MMILLKSYHSKGRIKFKQSWITNELQIATTSYYKHIDGQEPEKDLWLSENKFFISSDSQI